MADATAHDGRPTERECSVDGHAWLLNMCGDTYCALCGAAAVLPDERKTDG